MTIHPGPAAGRSARRLGTLLAAAATLLLAPSVAGAASISGTVSDETGAPITSGDVCVTASPAQFGFGATSGRTGADGRYTLPGLRTGPYYVRFDDCEDSSRTDVGQWYGSPRLGDSTVVIVQEDEDRTGVDQRLTAGTSISGTVVDEQGEPLSGICVSAQDTSGPTFPAPDTVGGATYTDADGRYVLRRIPPLADGYVVQFRDCDTQVDLVARAPDGRSASRHWTR